MNIHSCGPYCLEYNCVVEQRNALRDEVFALRHEVERLRAENRRLLKGLHAVDMLIGESYGVAGLHLNGDVASWGELRSGGRLEEWLRDFDAALEQRP